MESLGAESLGKNNSAASLPRKTSMNCTCNNFGRFADGTCRACRRATRIAMEAERRALRTRPAARPGPNDFEDYEPCANGRLLTGSR